MLERAQACPSAMSAFRLVTVCEWETSQGGSVPAAGCGPLRRNGDLRSVQHGGVAVAVGGAARTSRPSVGTQRLLRMCRRAERRLLLAASATRGPYAPRASGFMRPSAFPYSALGVSHHDTDAHTSCTTQYSLSDTHSDEVHPPPLLQHA